jgi:hypothetical protein
MDAKNPFLPQRAPRSQRKTLDFICRSAFRRDKSRLKPLLQAGLKVKPKKAFGSALLRVLLPFSSLSALKL